MSAIEYNEKKIVAGDFTPAMIQRLVSAWQRETGLEVDGKCGPMTQASIRRAGDDGSAPGNEIGLLALSMAIECLGKGEEGGNNSGPFVEMLFGKKFDGDDDDDGSWCAAFISHIFTTSYSRLGIDMPFKKSYGAKRLWRNIGNAGSFPAVPAPGDVVCWDRGRRGDWRGHTAIVSHLEGGPQGILHTIEGNTGGYPSVVRRLTHDLSRQDRIEGFARVPWEGANVA